jgi:threonine synthase
MSGLPLYSTKNTMTRASWRDAVLSGIAPDGGLYLPVNFPLLSQQEITDLKGRTFSEVATVLARRFIGDEVPQEVISHICAEAFNFPLERRELAPKLSVLELFHGPTCAFKDFGARFMARLFRYFWGSQSRQLTVLVATSGDTGSAVANAFFDPSPNPPIRVVILYPKDKVSDVQRRQMTTLGGNVIALQVRGTFDDCQSLVKEALRDERLLANHALTSANSINIARLLPQAFYYAYATLLFNDSDGPLFVVPSGNLGNLTGGIIADKIGFKCKGFIAACNSNETFPRFLSSGVFIPQSSVETISNAMDVGNPSNFYRITELLKPGCETRSLNDFLRGCAVSDSDTLKAIKFYHSQYGYVLDPHTAVGAVALDSMMGEYGADTPKVLVATAHPGKFAPAVDQAIGSAPILPDRLSQVLLSSERFVEIESHYSHLAGVLEA